MGDLRKITAAKSRDNVTQYSVGANIGVQSQQQQEDQRNVGESARHTTANVTSRDSLSTRASSHQPGSGLCIVFCDSALRQVIDR